MLLDASTDLCENWKLATSFSASTRHGCQKSNNSQLQMHTSIWPPLTRSKFCKTQQIDHMVWVIELNAELQYTHKIFTL
jgi:hypothetical protein